MLLNNSYFLSDCKVIIQRIGLVDKFNRHRRLLRALTDRNAILQPRIHSLIGIIDPTRKISCFLLKLHNGSINQFVCIALQPKILAQTILLDVLILIIRQVTDILIAQDFRIFKEADHSFLCFDFGIPNTHSTGTSLHQSDLAGQQFFHHALL